LLVLLVLLVFLDQNTMLQYSTRVLVENRDTSQWWRRPNFESTSRL